MKEEIVPTSDGHAEVITGGKIKTGTLADFHQAVYGKPLPAAGKRPVGLRLAVEKFHDPKKHYRLIWTANKQAWLAAEDTTHYATRRAGLLAAAVLGARVGVAVDGRRR